MPDLVTDGDNLGDHLATRSFKTIKGTDIASATNITIGTSGNTFDVTGTTTIQHFDNANWVVGSVISLHFDGAVTLTNNAGGLSGNQANILLSGDANFTTATGDILTFLLHDSTSWQEISRNSVASIANNSITNAKLATGIDAVKLADGSVTNAEFQYINSLTSNAQTQISAKAPTASPTFTGTVVLPNVPAIVTTQLNLKAPTASPTFTGTVVLPNVPAIVTTQLNLKSPIANPTFTGTVVLPNVPAIVTTQLNLKAPTANPTFTGTVTASALTTSGQITSNGNIQMGTGAKITNIKNLQHEVSTSGVDIDFSENQLQTMSIASNTTFTTTNRAVGLSKTIRIITDGTTRTLAFPSDWKFIGAKPTEQAGSKTGILTVTNFGTTDAYIVAGYAVEE
tara:strand:+ start:1570 stop:2760 length:1191 start_codon:yes stop_codon:yes gene_type:complete